MRFSGAASVVSAAGQAMLVARTRRLFKEDKSAAFDDNKYKARIAF